MKISRVIIVLAVMLTAACLGSIPASLAEETNASTSQLAGNHPTQVTYTKDIAPILFNNCATCHRPGQVAPFSLLTYQDAALHTQEIAWATASRYMPPWKAEPGYGKFKDEKRLSQQEIALIQQWLETGTVEGNPALLPPTPEFPDGDWQLGKPDVILKMPQPYTLAATSSDRHQCFVLPLNLPEDLYVGAFEYKPGNYNLVHHAILYHAPSDQARRLDAQDPALGYPCYGKEMNHAAHGTRLELWLPGMIPEQFSDEVARVIPTGSDIILENHYHPKGEEETDQGVVGIYLAKTSPQKLLFEIYFAASANLVIPPGEKRYQVTSVKTIPFDLQVIDISPHMHLLGQEMKVTATLPDGTVEPMVWVKDWDFDWQLTYQYEHPIKLPKGTKLEMVAYFDNSSDNPRNPNHPPKKVTWGMATTEEMAVYTMHVAVENNEEEVRKINKFYEDVINAHAEAVLRSRSVWGGESHGHSQTMLESEI